MATYYLCKKINESESYYQEGQFFSDICFHDTGPVTLPVVYGLIFCLPYLIHICRSGLPVTQFFRQPNTYGSINFCKIALCILFIIAQVLEAICVLTMTSIGNVNISPVIFRISVSTAVGAFALAIGVVELCQNILTSTCLFIMWLLLLIINGFRLASAITAEWHLLQPATVAFGFTIANLAIVTVETILYGFVGSSFLRTCSINGRGNGHAYENITETPDEEELKEIEENPISPQPNASVMSILTYFWLTPFVIKGWRTPIEKSGIYQLPVSERCKRLSKTFQAFGQNFVIPVGSYSQMNNVTIDMSEESDVAQLLPSEANRDSREREATTGPLIQTLMRSFGSVFLLAGLAKFFQEISLLAGPVCFMLLTNYIQDYQNKPAWHGYALVVIMLVASICQGIFNQRFFYYMALSSMRFRASLSAAIYEKGLRLSNASRQKMSVGEATSLIAADTSSFLVNLHFMHFLWSGPLELAVIIFLLYFNFGVATFAGLAVAVVALIISVTVARFAKMVQSRKLQTTDYRLKLTNELFENIKPIKIYAWEDALRPKIEQARNEELSHLGKYMALNLTTQNVWGTTPIIAALVTFAAYLYIDETTNLNPTNAFICVILYNLLLLNLGIFPQAISNLIQYLVALKRITKFLNMEELDSNAVERKPLSTTDSNVVVVKDGNFSWQSKTSPNDLSNVNVTIQQGKLVAVVGGTGSGKSSLLSAFLGEMAKKSGQVTVRGRVAYLPQTPWIQNATVKDNITFSLPIINKLYRKVVDACALKPDFEVLADGDATEIGDKGSNLSGGQKQRIALARAVYTRSDVYLMDDTLSAVDSYTGQHLFDKVIGPSGLLSKTTRVWVTHKLNFLPQCDHIIFMSAGKITGQGTFQELMASCQEFQQLAENVTGEMKQEQEQRISTFSMDRLSLSGSLRDSIISLTNVPANTQDIAGAQTTCRIVEQESMNTGGIKMSVYTTYASAMGIALVAGYALFAILFPVVSVVSETWLAKWTGDVVTNHTIAMESRQSDFIIYTVLRLVQSAVSVISSALAGIACFQASRKLHSNMLSSLIHTTIQFFEKTPASRIINRFSKDIDTVDLLLFDPITKFVMMAFLLLATVIVIAIKLPLLLVIAVPLLVAAVFMQRMFATCVRRIKQIEVVSQSPILGHFSETITGAASIRAFVRQRQFVDKFNTLIDANHTAYFAGQTLVGWLLVHTEVVGILISFLAALMGVLQRDSLEPSAVALALSYSMFIGYALFWSMQYAASLENNIVSVERLNEYVDTPKEPAWSVPEQDNSPEMTNWPTDGTVNFDNVVFRYREGLDPALRNLSFSIRPKEKVGVVGRTGAGKSSLSVVLLRIAEKSAGKITIDGVDVSKIGLHVLRNAITPVPQDPVLFFGSLRFNLDPFSRHSDETVERSLRLVNLGHLLDEPEGLEQTVAEGGSNFSAGQKQLLCLARALLRRPSASESHNSGYGSFDHHQSATHILLMDEATAAVDIATDRHITEMIRTQFADSTVITIAHRLDTIISYDRILVLSKGQVVEFDTPPNLLKNPNSQFYSMAKTAGLIKE